MGVGYLSRVAQRGLPAAMVVSGKVAGMPTRPAIASRSPVAEADQRLHLEDFADGVLTTPTEPADDAIDAGLDAMQSDESTGVSPSASPLPAAPRAPEPAPRSTPPRSGAAMDERGLRSARGVPPAASRQSGGRPPGNAIPALPASESASSDNVMVTQETTIRPADPPVKPRPSDAPEPQPLRRVAGERLATAPPAVRRSEPRPVTAAPTDTLTRRLAALERWLEGGSEPSTDTRRQSGARPATPADATGRPDRPVYAPRAEPALLERRPTLEIGSIEVEVIVPPKSRTQAEPRPQRRRSESATERGFRTKPFGWRQR
jgi:hypothetical protein